MAELFVPKIIDHLSDVALRQLEERVNLVIGVEEEVKNLSSQLTTIQKVLHDAESRRLKEKDVGLWLEKLEDITYEMEDVLDEWNIKIDRLQNLDQEAELKSRRISHLLNKVCSCIQSLYSCLKLVPVRSDIALKIKEINRKLEVTLTDANRFNFVITHGAYMDSNEFKRPMTTSIFDESEVQSRDSDKKVLLEHLLSESRTNTEKEGVKIISVVGAGGSGKTTLAQILYNDDRVQKHFELKRWVCVSDSFDEKRIANALLESLEKSNVSVSELETLLQLIKNTFSRKRFLVVFDDVWTEKDSEWKPFRDSLKDGAPGSIILVTTRSERVAKTVGTDYMHPLGLMSSSDCWLIMKRIALSGKFELCARVEKIGQRIAEKCKGLPLAAKAMGSLLRFKDTVQEWQIVLDSEIWQMEETAVELFPHFYMSYKELSPPLKRCFSYCAVYPKDTLMVVDKLIRLWMAQGYLGPPSRRGNDRMNVRGREYFKNLAMRSFFQELESSDLDENLIVQCKMHDIVHDFAKFIMKNECRTFAEVDCQKVGTNGGHLCKERVRHLTLLGNTKSVNSSVVVDIGKVRSLFIGFNGIPQDLFVCLKSVKTLTLSDCGLQELPREIGNLIHLRCLDVSFNSLKELPETICDLHYLESLDLTLCKVHHLPQRSGDLVHLRYLQAPDLEQMPPGLDKLTSLWCLRRFIADGQPLNDIGKLKYLNQLEELEIRVCGRVDFENAELGKKISLQFLILDFHGEPSDIENASSIERTEPPPNLQVLVFQNYPGPQLPKWIVAAESLINNLTMLGLWGGNTSSLPALGKLSSLRVLWIFGIENLKHIGREIFGLTDLQAQSHPDDDVKIIAFPSLKTLWIWDLKNWETWEDISEEDEEKMNNGTLSVMPRLETLIIDTCSQLEALPHRLLRNSSSLKQLRLLGCDKLEERYSNKTGADWMQISHIPQVEISKFTSVYYFFIF